MGCGAKGTGSLRSCQPPGDERTEPVGDAEWEPLPRCDRGAMARTGRVGVARRRAGRGPMRVGERPRSETPVALEVVRARADLRAAEIEAVTAALARMAHQREVHRVVGAQI